MNHGFRQDNALSVRHIVAALSRPTSRQILAIALPTMLSNVSTPLLGIVDTAVVGRIPDPAHLGAVALGALVYSFVLWAFGFLRMGTTGLVAQAKGAGDADEMRATLGRAGLIAGVVGLGLILLQWPIRELAFLPVDGSVEVQALARHYFSIRILGAPATLLNYAFLGWFIGQGRARTALLLQLVLNGANIVLDVAFVLGLGWGVEGVALGTLLAEVIASLTGAFLAFKTLRNIGGGWSRARLFDPLKLKRTFAVNRDIMVRSVALMFVFLWFAAKGASEGDVVLAANAVLMHLVNASAYLLDGFAFAAEALTGQAIGEGSRRALVDAIRTSTFWALGTAVTLTVFLGLGGDAFIRLLTVDDATRTLAHAFLPWAALAPLLGVWAFQLDGIFVGATRTAPMRTAAVLSLAIYLIAWWLLRPFGNTGLWASFFVHYVARAVMLGRHLPEVLREVA